MTSEVTSRESGAATTPRERTHYAGDGCQPAHAAPPTSPDPRDEMLAWLATRGFRADSSGWMVHNGVRIDMAAHNAMTIDVRFPERAEYWQVRVVGAPIRVVRALLEQAGITRMTP